MVLKGSPASEGIGLGRAIVIRESDSEISNTQVTDINTELNRFLAAVERAKEEIKEIKETAQRNLGEKNAMIFDAHLLILEDPELLNMVKENISKGMNAESALDESAKFFETILSSLEDEYMRERANDIRDVTSRVIKILSHKEEIDLKSIPSCSIVVARELTPSQTAQMNKQNVRGFVTEKGGKTSHTAIIARTYEILQLWE